MVKARDGHHRPFGRRRRQGATLLEEASATQMNEQSAGSQEVSANNGLFVAETEEPPGTGRNSFASSSCQVLSAAPQAARHPRWRDVDDRLWQDWHWQRQHAIRTVDQLTELLPFSPAEIAALKSLEAKYRMVVPPYYFSLIDVNDPHDPIRLQAIPSPLEAATNSEVELDDPLDEEQDSPVPGVIHRYPDRALLITTPVCSMYCRFCTRKRVTMDRDGWDAPSHDEVRMIEYIRETTDIRDVILSGGDPLTLPVAKLRWFVTQLAAIDHLDVIRVGTRVPVTLPQRLFDPELIELLAGAEKIWIQTHFNHPREITPEATIACRALVNAGMPISNHCVLLKGVNDRAGNNAEPGARTAAHQSAAVLHVPLRSGHRRRAFPHVGLEGIGNYRIASRPCFGSGRADLCGRRPARSRKNPADAELFDFGLR